MPAIGKYVPLGVPADGFEDDALGYRRNLQECNPGVYGVGDSLSYLSGNLLGLTVHNLRQFVESDSGANWNAACGCVVNSDFVVSPRVILLSILDPVALLQPGSKAVPIKLASFFIEAISGSGEITLRFVEFESAAGVECDPSQHDAGFVFQCDPVVQAQPMSWGRLKAIHR